MTHQDGARDLVARFAERYGFREDELLNTLAQTAFRQQNGSLPTREQLLSLLSVADQYQLNPFIRQLWGLPDRKGAILPVISVDGWIKIMNSYPESDGMEFIYSDQMVRMDEDTRNCHEWVDCVVYRKDRSHPVKVREYLDELYRPAPIKNGKKFPGPWQTCPKRMLRHKAQAQGIRVAYGLSGLFEPDEAERILETQLGEPEPLSLETVADCPVVIVPDKTETVPPQPVETTVIPDSGESQSPDITEASVEREVIEMEAVDVPDASDIDPQILSFIEQVVGRARDTGAYTAAQGFAQERFKEDANALNYCLLKLDQAQAASNIPVSSAA
ncbi:recombinase RecT [Endozoicomonas sp. 4G]|uniref:recombinase RecT n=1 Tax=Endozoicomonas sp. 4G TaxID=2872754 RepID=UPI002078D839|nr:recombinase RecT [Endozoicomonas sp. 4G]